MPAEPSSAFAPIERNIDALLARRREMSRRRGMDERIAAVIARFTGSMPFVYLHLLLFGAWIIVNLGWTPGLEFDPSFVKLAMVASVEAIFLTTFVLITQNRIMVEDEKRAELDLHISLLAEHEITKLLNLVRAIAEKNGVDVAKDPELGTLTQDVPPEKILDRIEAARGQAGNA